jgi:AraC-like DNA-binding protein/NADH:ubiquinone oxidoreductase subunit 6 (subunit J)
MEINFDFITLVHLVAVGVGVVSAAVIFYFGIKTNPANLPLGIAQLSVSMAIWVSFSLISQLLVYWPVFYRTGNIFVMIFIVMAFLHVDFYTRKRKWKWYDLIHALPLIIYLVDLGDVLWLSSAQKKELILQEINNLAVYGKFNQSKYLGPGFHLEFRTFLLSAYWVAQVVVFVRWLRNTASFSPENKVWKNWMLIFLGCQFFMWFPFYLSLIWLDQLTTYHIANSFAVIWLLISSISLFFFPSLLYGRTFDGNSKASKVIIKTPMTEGEGKKMEEIMQTIESQMEQNMHFLKGGYSIHDFSRDINIPAYQISKSLNTFRGLGFVDYVNQKRIRYCISKLEKGDWLNFTLEAVASECGFSNRNSFTKAFKKVMGVSPSEFRFGLENSNRK